MRLDYVLKVRHHSKSNTKCHWESLCDHLKNTKNNKPLFESLFQYLVALHMWFTNNIEQEDQNW